MRCSWVGPIEAGLVEAGLVEAGLVEAGVSGVGREQLVSVNRTKTTAVAASQSQEPRCECIVRAS